MIPGKHSLMEMVQQALHTTVGGFHVHIEREENGKVFG